MCVEELCGAGVRVCIHSAVIVQHFVQDTRAVE